MCSLISTCCSAKLYFPVQSLSQNSPREASRDLLSCMMPYIAFQNDFYQPLQTQSLILANPKLQQRQGKRKLWPGIKGSPFPMDEGEVLSTFLIFLPSLLAAHKASQAKNKLAASFSFNKAKLHHKCHHELCGVPVMEVAEVGRLQQPEKQEKAHQKGYLCSPQNLLHPPAGLEYKTSPPRECTKKALRW